MIKLKLYISDSYDVFDNQAIEAFLLEQAKKNALYACIIKGLPFSENAMGTPPLCIDAKTIADNSMYLEKLINKNYRHYITYLTDGVPSGSDLRQVGSRFKVAVYVQIQFDLLRKQLENDGIIRSLDYGF